MLGKLIRMSGFWVILAGISETVGHQWPEYAPLCDGLTKALLGIGALIANPAGVVTRARREAARAKAKGGE